MRARGWLLATGFATVCAGAWAGDVPAELQSLRTRSLAATCDTCHTTTGRNASRAVPANLAGMPAATLIARMKAFKTGAHPGTVMPQLAQGFSDPQVDQLARWFAAVTPDAR